MDAMVLLTSLCRFDYRVPLERNHRPSRVAQSVALTAVAQCGRDGVDRQLQTFTHARVVLARPMALEQLDLQPVERLDIGQTQAHRRVKRGMFFQQSRLRGYRE